MKRALLVMKMNPAHAGEVAKLFAESDATNLPQEIGVVHRSLFHHHGLYFHYVEAPDDLDGDIIERVRANAATPLFADIAQRLNPYLSPYAPDWRDPGDARAVEFYTWRAEGRLR